MNDLRTIIDKILVPHTAFQEATKRLRQYINYFASGASEPICVAIIGESRTGKSRFLETIRALYPAVRLDDGLQMPILFSDVPSRPTVKSVAELLLQAMGVKDWDKGTENAKTARLAKLMLNCGVLMLILDEFQHFFDKSSHKVQHHVADWLKNLIGTTRVALVVSGLPTLQHVIDQNEQLSGRFTSPIQMPRFDWLDSELRSEWIAILGAFMEGLAPHFELPELDSNDMSFRMFCATGGLMGYLSKTLRQAVWNAVDTNRRVITLEDIQRAHYQSIWSRERFNHLPSPFDPNHLLYPTPDVIAQARGIGVPLLQDTKQFARSRTSKPVPASIALVAK